MPTFDVVSEIDHQEVRNAVDQASREISTRFDFKNTGSSIELKEKEIELATESEGRLTALTQVLEEKMVKRKVSLKALSYGKVEEAGGGRLRQKISLQQGIPIEKAREIVRLVKDSKVRVQAAIQEDQVRVSGKNRDDLQKIIALVKEKDLGIALQFTNYRST